MEPLGTSGFCTAPTTRLAQRSSSHRLGGDRDKPRLLRALGLRVSRFGGSRFRV